MEDKGWYKDSEYVHLWIHLLFKANHEPNEWLYKNTLMKVNRGQLITSRKTLADETGINRSKVERILKCFENEQQIEQQNLFTSRLITILKYNDYQKVSNEMSSKRAASEQQVSTNKNDKNVRIKEKDSVHFSKLWDKYPNKQGKKRALKLYKSSVKNEQSRSEIETALENYLESYNVKRGYIKNGDTWFNNWQDWIEPTDLMLHGPNNNDIDKRTNCPRCGASMIEHYPNGKFKKCLACNYDPLKSPELK